MLNNRSIRLSDAADRLNSDCYVEFGNSAGWIADVKPPLSSLATFEAGSNIRIRGRFEYFYAQNLDKEGYQISVCITSLLMSNGNIHWDLIRHLDRVLVEKDAEPDGVKMVYEVYRVEHDGRYRTLLFLHALGPVCTEQSTQTHYGYGQPYPVSYGGVPYQSCTDLNAVLSNRP